MCMANISNESFDGQNETRNGQVLFPLGIEYCIAEDDMVRFFAVESDKLDYSKLRESYYGSSSPGGPGRPPTDPKLLFQICVFGYANDLYSSRKIEEACKKRIDFIWLLDGERAPDHTTISTFRSGPCKEAIEYLFYQYVHRLSAIGATDNEVGIFDGTKVESFANRYTFVWRGTVEKNKVKLIEKAKAVFERLGIQGDVTKEKLESVVTSKRDKMSQQQINPVYGKGRRKSQLQRDYEELSGILEKWTQYDEHLRIMGPDRNSYSKTDPDATFHRMKDDHMGNGQLKPGYNLQICVNSEFITGLGIYDDRSDVTTFEHFLEFLDQQHGIRYECVSADAGYESLSNYRLLDRMGMISYIKPTIYDSMGTKKFKSQIGRRENMAYDEIGDYYVCANGRKLMFSHEHTFTPKNAKLEQTNRVYRCEDCVGCPLRQKCSKAKDVNTPKEIEVNLEFLAYRDASLINITSEYGIKLRTNRSIQVEGAFGNMKHNHHFKRFLCGGKDKVSSEMYLLAFGHNIRKLHRKIMDDRLDSHLFKVGNLVA